MALFGQDATNLEQVLGNQAQTQALTLQDQKAQARKKLVAQQAHQGRLLSGVADFPLTDFDTAAAGAEGDIYGNLTQALGQIPAEDYGNQKDYQRNLQLAQLVGRLNKPSSLQEALGALGQFGNIAGNVAAFL